MYAYIKASPILPKGEGNIEDISEGFCKTQLKLNKQILLKSAPNAFGVNCATEVNLKNKCPVQNTLYTLPIVLQLQRILFVNLYS